ncbi:LytTR family DNA-binding domain-containing protein [Rheinheimera sp.]|uniref:LytTR family DNA-binding domain-containing protein n=1 Tax=Rheinheimera sp. TaxID=1869214 RepID=UPI00273309C9|nr:LytTR family DNA-binding domain-containing protein [Rheinheimera sp.]MDP2714624.1 LytTR family DNA-binding domain-containing protein [Rheinheimera sp.]
MDKQLRQEWLVSLLGWSGVIIFLSLIDTLHDLWVPDSNKLNNYPLWALQEWGLWLLFTPLLFRLLSQSAAKHKLNNRRYLQICALIFLNTMLYQALFDLIVLNDSIAYSLLYFAPVHPVVIFINVYIWHRYVALPPVQLKQSDGIHCQTLAIEQPTGTIQLPCEDIIQINAASNYVEVCTAERSWLKRATLKDIETQLPQQMFIRTHRAHLVNIQHIASVRLKSSGSGFVELKSGRVVALSKAHKQAVRARLQNAA